MGEKKGIMDHEALQKLLDQKQQKINRFSKELKMQREEIESQKEVIENQRDVAIRQRDEITRKQSEITSSIAYARRIQSALLPDRKNMSRHFTNHFVFFKPKDIVSGDFYWIGAVDENIVVSAADATGHGVPGALMSMMGSVFMNEIVEGMGITSPDQILNKLREKIIHALGQDGGVNGSMDGMDMSVIVLDKKNMVLNYAGAFNPVYILREGNLMELKADRMPIGYYHFKFDPFSKSEFSLETGDRVYMFSDGFVDQFGWRSNKKFMASRFKELLLEIQDLPLNGQHVVFENTLNNWKGDMEQLDDILVMGLQI
jgi:serine phosphatase RsbU (regulator of sigma subunit)